MISVVNNNEAQLIDDTKLAGSQSLDRKAQGTIEFVATQTRNTRPEYANLSKMQFPKKQKIGKATFKGMVQMC